MTKRLTRLKGALATFGLTLLLVAATACSDDEPAAQVDLIGDASTPEAAAKAPAAAEPTSGPTAAPTAAPTAGPPTQTPAIEPSTPVPAPAEIPAAGASALTGNTPAPELAETGEWINSEPFTLSDQFDMGKVVLIDFWTYTCINCI